MSMILGFIWGQLFTKLPTPTASFDGKTVIVTGSNVGLGKEAARHIAQLRATKLIIAVRDVSKGEAARQDILNSSGRPESSIEVWQLDLSSYDSVRDFAERANKLARVDVLLSNAGIAPSKYTKAEEDESTITVNVVSTFLLTFLILPKMRETAKKFNTRPITTIVSSEVHAWTDLPERNDGPDILEVLSDKATANMSSRYPASKLLEVLLVREFAARYPAASFPITVNTVNPGLCHSELSRDGSWVLEVMKFLLARSTEKGSRTHVHAASQGPESHGQYLSDCHIASVSPFTSSEEGRRTGERLWTELAAKLERISPGIMAGI